MGEKAKGVKVGKYVKKGKKTTMTKTAVPQAIKDYVKSKITVEREVKMAFGFVDFVAQSATISSIASNIYNTLPQIAQGVGNNQRIGDIIRPQKLVIKGYVAIVADSVNTQAVALAARLFCFQDKSIKSSVDIASLNLNILDFGGVSTAYGATLRSQCTPHNNHMYDWYSDKKMSFHKATGTTNATALGGGVSSPSPVNQLFKEFTITLTKKDLPANLYYDSTESNIFPVNCLPVLALGYCDPMTTFTPTNFVLGFGWTSTLYYTDS